MKLIPRRKKPTRLEQQLAEFNLETAMGRAEPAVPEPEPEPELERMLCYSPNGGYAHDDTGGAVPRPACHAGARRYTRADGPTTKAHAAKLKPCPRCAERRESSET